MSAVWIVYLEPIYDAFSQTYIKILTVSDMPDMPLMQYVKRLRTSKLSNLNTTNTGSKYVYAIMKQLDEPMTNICQSESQTDYMEAEDIPRLFGYLVSNGYMIESGWTSILQKSKVSLSSSEKKTLMFVFRKN